jgi:hypothetical protein
MRLLLVLKHSHSPLFFCRFFAVSAAHNRVNFIRKRYFHHGNRSSERSTIATQRLQASRAARWQPSNPGAESVILEQGAGTMIAIDKLTDEQFQRHALEVLKRELGADGLARFLRLHRSGPGDYTRDRDEWQKDLTLDQVLESIREHRQIRSR